MGETGAPMLASRQFKSFWPEGLLAWALDVVLEVPPYWIGVLCVVGVPSAMPARPFCLRRGVGTGGS